MNHLPPKTCKRCKKMFTPRQPHYVLCEVCFRSTKPVGRMQTRRYHNAGDERVSGTSRVWDNRTASYQFGADTLPTIFTGLGELLSDVTGEHNTRISTVLRDAGFTRAELDTLREDKTLVAFAARFVPALRHWLLDTLGPRGTEALFLRYGLYGEAPKEPQEIAANLAIEADHAARVQGWALRQLRSEPNQTKLKTTIIETARDLLTLTRERGTQR